MSRSRFGSNQNIPVSLGILLRPQPQVFQHLPRLNKLFTHSPRILSKHGSQVIHCFIYRLTWCHTRTHTRTHTRARAHTHTHTYIYIYIYIYIYMDICRGVCTENSSMKLRPFPPNIWYLSFRYLYHNINWKTVVSGAPFKWRPGHVPYLPHLRYPTAHMLI